MTYSTSPYPTSGMPPQQPPRWRVAAPQRVSRFPWFLSSRWSISPNNPLELISEFIEGVVTIMDAVFLVPTLGPIRLAIHHARTPGWYVEARYGTALAGAADSNVELQTRRKRQAKRLRRVLRTELGRGADFNAPTIQSAIARNKAFIRPASRHHA